ncbi:8-oxoguanine glycosylase ogg1 [Microbotryomycetes sp. JL221]|nr:8-oxoguanine glycosylase ogg1 [Microbotryomycetes sp. JL221]
MAAPLATPLRFLPLLPSELQLATVLKSGQAFRWARFDSIHATRSDYATSNVRANARHDASDPSSAIAGDEHTMADSSVMNQRQEEWAMGWNDRTVVLRQDAKGIHYRALFPRNTSARTSFLADLEHDTTRRMLVNYFQLDTPLAPLYAEWAAKDNHFRRKVEREGERLEGIRVLNQDPWETVVSFICSSNNNISRITLMVNRVCEALGMPLPHPSTFDPALSVQTIETAKKLDSQLFDSVKDEQETSKAPALFAFPPPSALASPSTDLLLRQLGFGYRAPFIEWTANYLIDTSSSLKITPHEYLETLRKSNFNKSNNFNNDETGLQAARDKLMEFKGVGRKVADCIALFSLGWTETVPVDTHVYQIAIRDYNFPSSKSTSMTTILHDKVSERLKTLWGNYAGWCQQILFFADLKQQQNVQGSGVGSSPMKRSSTPVSKKFYETTTIVKNKFQDELDELMRTPGTKRRRIPVLKTQVKGEDEEDDDRQIDEVEMVKKARLSDVGYPSPAATIVVSKKRTVGKVKAS